ncbi:MAG: GAF domain-containing protein [Chloroflexi bacterium]|nr:GAF domain-containing protein [Chloroflexota bacterium]
MNKFFEKQTIEEQKARKTIMEVAYLSLSAFLFLTMILAGLPNSFATTAERVGYLIQGFIALVSLICYVLSRLGNPTIGAYFIPSGLLLMAVYFIYHSGIGTPNDLFFITIIVIASITVGIRGTALFTALSIVAVVGLYFAQRNGLLLIKTEISFLMIVIILAHVLGNSFILIFLIRTFNKNLYRAQEANQELRQLQASLEQRVADRTRDLGIASDVSRQITRVLDLDILLPELVERTRQGFNLYSVSLFLYDQQKEELLLVAGTGREGARMKSEAKSFHISARPSLVAQAARERSNVVINDVEKSDSYFHNPHLPETKSEAVFSMLVGERLVGTLDLQSKEKNFFGGEEIQIFVTLAEQIAIAVRNADLYGLQTKAAEELRRSDLMKSQFLSSMSHELRTPLNAIINFTELVALGMVGPVNEEQKELLDNSLKSSLHLLHLINDVLDISKIQAGKLTLFIEQDVDLYAELKTVTEMVLPMFRDKPVELVQDIDDHLPVITGDKRRIRQVLLNLLSNAIKFTDKGTVTMSAKLQDDEIVFAVIDTGLGISPEAQSVIFEPFVQTVDGIKMEQGTGLGLPISRSLVKAHGGELWMESQRGDGSAFYFTLPANRKS